MERQAGARHSTQPTSPRSCARPKSIQLQKSNPRSGQARRGGGRSSVGSRLPHGSTVLAPGPAQNLPPTSTGTGPVVLRIGIHHVAPSLVLPASLSSPLPSLLKYHHPSHPSRGSFPVFWCELESWKWSSSLDRIKVEHRDEEGRYLAGVLGTTEFFSRPHQSLSSCEYTEAFLLMPRLPCLFVCLAWILYLVLGSPPACPSVDHEEPSCERCPAIHGAVRPYRRRSDWSSRRGGQTSCRLLQSFRICRGPRQKNTAKNRASPPASCSIQDSLLHAGRGFNQRYRCRWSSVLRMLALRNRDVA